MPSVIDSQLQATTRMKDHCGTMAVQVESVDESEPMEIDISSEPINVEMAPLTNGDISENSSNCEVLNGSSGTVLNGLPQTMVNGISEILPTEPSDYDIAVSNFISNIKAVSYGNVKGKLDQLMLNINNSLKTLSNLMQKAEQTSQEVAKHITDSKPIFNTPVPTPFGATIRNSGPSIPPALPSTPKEAVIDGLEILKTVSEKTKVNLPPSGDLVRRELTVNTRVWAMKKDLLNVWIKGTITSIKDGGNEKVYRVRFDTQKSLGNRAYLARNLAYESTPTVIVPVGTRIIAKYVDTSGRGSHYAGIVAEPPKVTNLERYLIFFDDGCAQYVKHEDIYVVCYQSVDVADDVHEQLSDFIRGYLQQYPERPMVKLQKDQCIKTEYNFEWSDARVLEVDCSMVKMLFSSTLRTEWIYRGSTRLKPLRNELANAELHRLEGKNRRRHNIPRRPHQPYIEYTREDVVVIDSDSDDDKKTELPGIAKPTKPRNTARKSLGGRAFTTLNVRANPIYHVTDRKSHLGYKDQSRIKAFTRTPFHNHDCGIHCRERDDPIRHKGKNPLLIPILLGWERQLRKFRACGPGPKQIVTYRSFCGRHLRHLQDIQNYLYLIRSRLTIDLFSVDPNLNLFRSFRPKEELYSTDDITQGRENVPVSCVNSLCDEPPPYVEYSAERFPGEGVFLNLDPNFLCGCDCTDNCQNPATCACQQITNYAKSGNPYSGEAGYRFRRLREPIVTGIYECNVQCKCNSLCGNRVVQNGLTVRLQMFKTQYKGWGIRCLDDIDAGQFICVYAGQLLTEQGADADGKECGDEYLAELDHIEVVEKTKEGYESDVPELKMETDDIKVIPSCKEEIKEEEEEEENRVSSDDNFAASSDSDVIFDSDSEFESSFLRSTATSTYATRSRQRNRKKRSGSPDSASNAADDSNSLAEKYLPDLTTNLGTFKINPRPPSPQSAEVLEKIELKRKPKISENADMDVTLESPAHIKKESDELDEKPKCELSIESEDSADIKCQRVVAKKSVSMKNPLTSFSYEQKDYKFKSLRSFFGEDSLYIMDAKSKGNIGRYLNHSCEPNVFVQNVFVDSHDLRFPAVAFFAHDTIDAGTELTWDYNYEVGSVTDKVMYCYCEASSCRGRLL